MYLMAWNKSLWPAEFPKAEAAIPAAYVVDPRQLYSRETGQALSAHAHYRKQVELLERSRAALSAIRRAFANLTTYMMFDDHDVTDDWNLARLWREGVYQSPAGRRVVANALAAFWAFQAWGNDPEMFGEGFLRTITQYLGSEGKDGAASFEKALLEFPDWSFVAPTVPPLFFLDTRTRRDYVTPLGPSALLGVRALSDLESRVRRSDWRPSQPLLIVSPAPVYGFELLEQVQSVLADLSGPYKIDVESWRANTASFLRFLSRIADSLRPRNCVFFSGDVHYAFSIRAELEHQHRGLKVVQLTSSSLKNTGASNRRGAGGILEPVPNRTDRVLGWLRSPPSARVTNLDRALEDAPAIEAPGRTFKKTAILKALNQEPVFLHAADAALLEITEPPDWTESITYLAQQPSANELPIVGDNNLGLVRFEAGWHRLEHHLLVPRKGKAQPLVIELRIDL
jgi:hypothetical protein